MTFIDAIGIANPAYRSKQMDIFSYMSETIDFTAKEQKVLRYLYAKSGIETRYSVLSDFSPTADASDFYLPEDNYSPSIDKRLARYDEASVPLALEAIENCLKDSRSTSDEITHLITVSCTGMSAPGMDTAIIKALKLSNQIQRYNINFMGCYAALTGLQLANTICTAQDNARVLVVAVELCTLHFQNQVSADYNLSNMLFADGAAAAVVTNVKEPGRSFAIHGFESDINHDGQEDMSWKISSNGFLMKLSSYVPQLLKLGFRNILNSVLEKHGVPIGQVHKWAIHPGGKRILDNVVQEFDLADDHIEASRQILRDYGNMSSPTILFVLKSLQDSASREAGQYIFTAGFGPGLTTETALLSYA